ncbi:MAG: radical SAM protein [candidate division WOR-3 bacterium]
MNVIFLIPPVSKRNRVPERVFGCSYGLYPIPNIFILTFAAILREDGNAVEVIDAPIMKLGADQFYAYLKTKENSCFVFYSVNLSTELDISIGRRLRIDHPRTPIIFCGPAPTYNPSRFLIDQHTFVIRGEPDYTLKTMVRYLRGDLGLSLKEIKGISYLGNDGIIDNPFCDLITSLDELPFPARDLIRRDQYYNPKLKLRPFTAMITSRGCPYRCSFCVPCSLTFARKLEYQRFYGISRIPPVAFSSPKRVIAEFELLKREGYRAVSIIDDEFLLKPQRVKEICRGIKGFNIKWGCLARADHLNDEELIQLMAEAGCEYVDIGIESFNQKILDDIKKEIDVRKIPDTIKLLKKYKIEPKLNILVASSPLETRETIIDTIQKAMALKPGLIMYNICLPFPGTELYRRAKSEKWFINGDYKPVDVQKESIIQFPHLKVEEIERIVRRANLRFFLQFRFILSNLKIIFNLRDFFIALKEILRKF